MKQSLKYSFIQSLDKFILLLVLLLYATSNSAFSQDSTWNVVKDNEDWDISTYRPPTDKRRIALSLSRLQEALRNSEIKPEASLPITNVKGIIFDDSGDIILLGIEESGDGVIYIVPDDIILAMRSMLISDQPPGMSIDPIMAKDGSGMEPEQDVVYFGGLVNTRAGLFAFNCDYWMKQLAAGKIGIPVKNFSRYYDLLKRDNVSLNNNKGNRFWFYPKESQFTISPDYNIMTLHENNGIEVLTEEQRNLFENKSFKSLYSSNKIDPLAKKFTNQLTSSYGELSSVYPDLAKLKNFFSLCEIFKWAEKRGIRLEFWKYLLYEYNPVQIHTPSKVDTVKVMLFSFGTNALFLEGGVQAEFRLPSKPIIDKFNQLETIKQAVYTSKPISKNIFWEYLIEKKTYASSPIGNIRLKDIKEASINLENGLITELYVEEENLTSLTVIDSNRSVKELPAEVAKELRYLLKNTSNAEAKLGDNLLKRWDKFYHNYMSSLVKPTYRKILGKTVLLKPHWIIKSNEVNYKYANLERVPVLTDNLIISIDFRDSAKNLVSKINNIPKLALDNIVFTIRLPEVNKSQELEWISEIEKLKKIVGNKNVLFNPNKKEFAEMMENKNKDIIMFELTHTEEGILLRNGEIYKSNDIVKGGDLSHIKYLIGGGSCKLPRLENGQFIDSLIKRGIGIINASYREVSIDIALKRLRLFINILENIEKYDINPFYLPDIIDLLLDIPRNGTTNLGRLVIPKSLINVASVCIVPSKLSSHLRIYSV